MTFDLKPDLLNTDYSDTKSFVPLSRNNGNIMQGVADFSNSNSWSRMGNQYYVNNNQITDNDLTTNYANSGRNCYNTGISANACSSVINAILSAPNINGIIVAINSVQTSDWIAARNAIKNMHPNLAIRILKRFGFEKVSCSVNGNTSYCVESVDDWYKKTGGVIGNIPTATIPAPNPPPVILSSSPEYNEKQKELQDIKKELNELHAKYMREDEENYNARMKDPINLLGNISDYSPIRFEDWLYVPYNNNKLSGPPTGLLNRYQLTRGLLGMSMLPHTQRGGANIQLSTSNPQHLAFLQWLGYLAIFINRNPRILNYNATAPVPPTINKINDGIATWIQPSASDADYSSNLLKLWGLRRPVSTPIVQAHPVFGLGFANMMGGSVSLTCAQAGGATTPAQFLGATLNRELNLLKSMGKNLSDDDRRKVDKLISKLTEKEQQIVALINGSMAYGQDMRDARDFRNTTISQDTLASYAPVAKTYGRYVVYQDKLTQILVELRKLSANAPYVSGDRTPL